MSTITTITRRSSGSIALVQNGVTQYIDNPTNVRILFDADTIKVISIFDAQTIINIPFDGLEEINGVATPATVEEAAVIIADAVFAAGPIVKFAQEITFAAPATRAHTAPAFSAGATSSSGLGVTYISSDPTKATVGASTGLITPIGAGTTTITASQAGNAFYNAAPDVPHDLVLS